MTRFTKLVTVSGSECQRPSHAASCLTGGGAWRLPNVFVFPTSESSELHPHEAPSQWCKTYYFMKHCILFSRSSNNLSVTIGNNLPLTIVLILSECLLCARNSGKVFCFAFSNYKLIFTAILKSRYYYCLSSANEHRKAQRD